MLTDYQFSCGNFIRKRVKTNVKEIYKEHGTYHVRKFNYKGERILWESFDTMKDAVKFFNSIKE